VKRHRQVHRAVTPTVVGSSPTAPAFEDEHEKNQAQMLSDLQGKQPDSCLVVKGFSISLALFVFARGEMSKTTKRHETIHYLQWVELGFIGFLLLYPSFWLINFVRYRDGDRAYREIPFEREAYGHEEEGGYLATRKRYAWLKYVTSSSSQAST
jgi:hypothetical protein